MANSTLVDRIHELAAKCATMDKALANAIGTLETSVTNINVNGSGSRNVGEIFYSLIPVNNAGVHLVDGTVLSGSGTYAEFITYVAGLRSSYPNLFATEADWQSSVTQYGVCGKFVYDEQANTLRLPKVTGHIAGTLNPTALGDLVEAGLPNITGGVGSVVGGSSTSGAFYGTAETPRGSTTGSGFSVNNVSFDASRSSSIYGNNITVQPQAIKGFVYIVLANAVKTSIQVDINNVSADLNLKADVSLGNVTAAGNVRMAHAAMPSEQYIDYSVNYGANDNVWGYTDITAPADGWIYLYASAGNTRANTNIDISVRGTNNELIYACSLDKPSTNSTGSGITALVPIKAGALARISVRAIASDSSHLPVLRFIYANGSAPTNL